MALRQEVFLQEEQIQVGELVVVVVLAAEVELPQQAEEQEQQVQQEEEQSHPQGLASIPRLSTANSSHAWLQAR